VSSSPDEKEIRERCTTLLSAAAEEARKLGHNYVGVEHLFIACTREEDTPTSHLLRKARLDPRAVRAEIRRDIGVGDGKPSEVIPYTPRAEIILQLAIMLYDRDRERDQTGGEVDEAHFLIAMLQEGESIPIRKLLELNFDLNYWLKAMLLETDSVIRGMMPPPPPAQPMPPPGFSRPRFGFQPPPIDDDPFDISDEHMAFGSDDLLGGEMGSSHPTPLLDKYGRDLTAQAANGKIGPAIARDREIRALARTLARSKKNNPLLLGDAGVGKTAVVEGLAFAIHNGTAAKSLLNRRIIQVEIGTLVAGTSLRGQFEERLIGIVDEARAAANVILFIDEIHTIVGAGDTIDSNLDAANILKPALARGDIMVIGATTHAEYRKAIAQDPALDRRFRTIDIEEPGEAATLEIIKGQRERLEKHHGVTLTDAAMDAAIALSVRYMPDRRLPDKALDLLDEACTRVIIRTSSPDEFNGVPAVEVENIAAVLSDWTGIPVHDLSTDEKKRLAGLEIALQQRVAGQDHAVRLVAESVRTARAGLGDPGRPVGVFMFLGPSGVGKTELARALAEFLFGSEEAMLRLDMSEFHDAHTVARLIGAPPGYKDADRGGQLTDGLRRRPYTVVLLDEVEKAAAEVFDIFLQVFDEGRITDSQGRTVDARNAVFILTSNIGTGRNTRKISLMNQDEDDAEPDYTPFLKEFFRPELLNRLDEVVTFRPLNRDALNRILDLQLKELYDRLKKQKLSLILTDDARQLIIDKGTDAANGARPLRRAIERLVTRPLSTRIVEDTFKPGDVIHARVEGDALHFERAEAAVE